MTAKPQAEVNRRIPPAFCIETRFRYDLAMRWLLHGTMTPAVAEALVRHEHKVVPAADIALATESPASEVLKAAHKSQLDVLTTDADLVEAAVAASGSGEKFGRSIVYLQLEGGDVEQDDAIDRLFERYKRLAPGRLYTVTASRVKIRQLPGAV